MNQHISVTQIAQKTEKPLCTTEYHLKRLKDKGIIERFGSDKTDGYRIIQQQNNNSNSAS